MIPIPASPEEDGGGSGILADPAFVATIPDMPGPIPVSVTKQGIVSITIRDANLEDTIHVRIFRDYQDGASKPIIEKNLASVGTEGDGKRSIVVETLTWCQGIAPGGQGVFDVVVADRPFSDDLTLTPKYQVVTQDGRSSRATWFVNCVN